MSGAQVSPGSVDSADGVDLICGGGAAPRPPLSEVGVGVGSVLIASSVAFTDAFIESSPADSAASLRFAGLGVQPAIMAVGVSNKIVRGVITLIKDFAISIRVKLLISMIVSLRVV